VRPEDVVNLVFHEFFERQHYLPEPEFCPARARVQDSWRSLLLLYKLLLWGANLEGAKNLTVEQLSTVKTLYDAHLDPPLLEQIRRRYPHLLEKPQGQVARPLAEKPWLEREKLQNETKSP
jgi:hypothetical protein